MRWLGLVFVALLLPVSSTNSFGAIVWIKGHGDIGVEAVGNDLALHYHIHDAAPGNFLGGVGNVENEPGDLIVGVPSARQEARGAGSIWNFTGTSEGAPLWVLPSSDLENHPYVGFAAETDEIGTGWSNFRFSVTAMTGPGQFSMWSGGGTPLVRVSADRSVNEFTINAGAHNHINMGFTAEGMYDLTFQVVGTRTDGSPFTASDTFTFAVGDNAINISAVPEPSSLLLLGLAGLGASGFAWRSRITKIRDR